MAGGPAGFNLGSSCPDLLRILLTYTHFACTGFSPSPTGLSMPFQFFAYSYLAVLLPPSRRNEAGLGCAAFARHYLRYHCCFLFLLLLRCFSSEGSLLIRGTIYMVGCPIRISADQRLFAPPRSFSQLITSFFALQSLGILRMPLFSFYAR